MGAAKHAMIMREELIQLAIPIAVKAGALKECWLHGSDIVMRTWDSEAERKAYAMGTNTWKAGDVAGDREALMSAMKYAIEFSPEDCWRCEKLKAEWCPEALEEIGCIARLGGYRLMAPKRKKVKGDRSSSQPEAAGEFLMLRPVLDVTDETPQYYANHAEINFTVHDFLISFGRLSGRIGSDQIETLRETGAMRVRADVQILIPASLVAGLIRALSSQKEQYEKQHGMALKDLGGVRTDG
jgi:hypothetical protein